ncbi:hypothetical protein CROQUDRAFT_43281 [Cronartium quercuum f. sp. fusiforme G11]|uniref:DUF3533 domain-containing protein n=1 Tax=Cronartium quercuum f. sp. fusiforme G11 TaxID=708437 RepID=A0A9P6TCY5_9BASI|nr:hypothetical protein CROQUDRAFT_43281 [Cronartium quercuum f. sp. fusiforme G11]
MSFPAPHNNPSLHSSRTAHGRLLVSPAIESTDSLPSSKPFDTRVPISKAEPDSTSAADQNHTSPSKPPFSHTLFDPAISRERSAFIKMIIQGVSLTGVLVLSILSIYWGSLWKMPEHVSNLKGIVVDFDQGVIGQAVMSAFMAKTSGGRQLNWVSVDPSRYAAGPQAVAQTIIAQDYWVAVVINPGASIKLQNAVIQGDSTYLGAGAVTVYGVQARNDNAYGTFIIPDVHRAMQNAQTSFATNHAQSLANTVSLPALLKSAPQTITEPLGYVINNLRPFDVPVAQATVFVGLIYLLIISFVATLINLSARMTSGLYQKLDLRSLLILRVITPLFMYFWLAWFYSFISLIYQVPFSRYYGGGGFLLYWAMSFMTMAALGLAVESLITILTPRFIPYFLILWLITNISVATYPIEILPGIYKYGYVTPFYHVTKAVRSIVFNTKNELGLNFGVQFAWLVVSLITLPLLQSYKRRKETEHLRQEKSSPL